MRGNRTTKVDSGAFDAFNSPNLTPLARLEIDIIGNYYNTIVYVLKFPKENFKGHLNVE